MNTSNKPGRTFDTSIYLFIYLSIHPSIHPSIYLYMSCFFGLDWVQFGPSMDASSYRCRLLQESLVSVVKRLLFRPGHVVQLPL